MIRHITLDKLIEALSLTKEEHGGNIIFQCYILNDNGEDKEVEYSGFAAYGKHLKFYVEEKE